MDTVYLAVTILVAAMAAFSGLGKIRREPPQARVIHETVGIPLKYVPALAAGEFAGAVGLALGIWCRFWTWWRASDRPFTLWGRLSRICVQTMS